MANPERLILVDGSALIYRAYYAIPASFTTSAGLHTNAIYGFATMFRKVLSGRTPEKGAVVFDAPGKTFRDEMYADYSELAKAIRPASNILSSPDAYTTLAGELTCVSGSKLASVPFSFEPVHPSISIAENVRQGFSSGR